MSKSIESTNVMGKTKKSRKKTRTSRKKKVDDQSKHVVLNVSPSSTKRSRNKTTASRFLFMSQVIMCLLLVITVVGLMLFWIFSPLILKAISSGIYSVKVGAEPRLSTTQGHSPFEWEAEDLYFGLERQNIQPVDGITAAHYSHMMRRNPLASITICEQRPCAFIKTEREVDISGAKDDYAIRWLGYIEVEKGGTYSFKINLDYNSRFRMFLDSKLFMQFYETSYLNENIVEATVELESGIPVQLDILFEHMQEYSKCVLEWRPPYNTEYGIIPPSVLRPARKNIVWPIPEYYIPSLPEQKSNPVRRIWIFGERKSGTTWSTKMIAENIAVPDGVNGGRPWKHGLTRDYYKDGLTIHSTVYVYITRNIYSWLKSMERLPVTADHLIYDSTMEFLSLEWYAMNLGTEDLRDRNVDGTRFKNVIHLRKIKLNNWISESPKFTNKIHAKYEDIVRSPNVFLQKVHDQFNLALRPTFQNTECVYVAGRCHMNNTDTVFKNKVRQALLDYKSQFTGNELGYIHHYYDKSAEDYFGYTDKWYANNIIFDANNQYR